MDEFIPPVPFTWLKKFRDAIPNRRGTSPCIALCTAIALYYAYKISKSTTFKLNRAIQIKFGLNYRNTKRSLKIWEKQGLLKIQWGNGQAITITLQEMPAPSSGY